MDNANLIPIPCLSKIVGAILAMSVGGCCAGVEDEPWTADLSEVLPTEWADEIRENYTAPRARCEAACVELSQLHGDRSFERGDVTSCAVEPMTMEDGDPEDPWDPIYTGLVVTCTAEGVTPAFCTGRRPLGHREATLVVDSMGAWFAVHAHLEQASITAFEELAIWLQDRAAPAALIDACRSARRDEIDHARRMSEQAQQRGAQVPAAEAEPGSNELMDVALHNAVEGCVSEAFAAVVAAHQRREVEDPELRELFGVLAEDELRHGQLAWELHAWLLGQLSPAERVWVEQAQARALARLPALARRDAELTPAGLGWPTPALAEAMARRFAEMVGGTRAAA